MIIPKAIDIQSISALVSTSGNAQFINFGYSEYINLDTDSGAYEAFNTYSAVCNLSILSYNWAINSDTQKYDYVKVNMGDSAHIFTNGEYQDFNGTPYDVSGILATITNALGL